MKLKLVSCSQEYWEYVRKLRLDSRVIDGFVQTTHITGQDQISYMTKHSDNYRIALIDGHPCGYVGVIENDIRVCTDPDYQGKGIGKFMINELKKIWPDAIAKVKISNEASFKLFKSCGFEVEFLLMVQKS
ncbi:GNAT family N-acetyltransferase [Schleiferiaceae bacterium]|nr:GNAT family N-acetyltransferase [Schleiferiaceae bacterium]